MILSEGHLVSKHSDLRLATFCLRPTAYNFGRENFITYDLITTSVKTANDHLTERHPRAYDLDSLDSCTTN